MAEERTLGLARAQDLTTGEEPSKEELQRRLDEARDSISHTVGEIRESVANQVQAVKESLDWREQFKKRPVAWSAGAMGVGFLVGYGLAAMVKGESDSSTDYDRSDRYEETSRSYASQPILGSHAMAGAHATAAVVTGYGNGKHDEGPGLIEKLTATPAFHKVKQEASNVGDALVKEITNTAKTMVIPALITSLRNFIGGHLPNANKGEEQQQSAGYYAGMQGESERTRSAAGSYQPSLERNQTPT